jgi:hypothetical protein
MHRPNNFAQYSIIFCHEVRASTGQKFLLVGFCQPSPFVVDNTVTFAVTIVLPGDLSRDPRFLSETQLDKRNIESLNFNRPVNTVPNAGSIGGPRSAPPPIPVPKIARIFPGQLDPTNPSHFSFVVEEDGDREQVDFWLGEVDAKGVLHEKISSHRIP